MKRPGFTLVEMMVVAAAFSIIFLVATTVYSNAYRNHRKIQSYQRTASDARYLLETIARPIRIGTINYATITGNLTNNQLDIASTPLALLNNDGTNTCFKLVAEKIQTATTTTVGQTCATAGLTWSDITPNDITVDAMGVYVYPATNPYSFRDASGVASDPPNIQPHVTLFLKTTNITRGESTTSIVQTTVTSRLYKR